MAGLLGTCLLLTVWPFGGQAVMPGSTRVPLAFLLPFIAWAAVRFGPTGASVRDPHAPRSSPSPPRHTGAARSTASRRARRCSALQLLLTAVAMPHLVLAAAIDGEASGVAGAQRAPPLRAAAVTAVTGLPSCAQRADGRSIRDLAASRGRALHVDGLMLFRLSDETHELMPCAAWMRPGAMGTPVRDPAHDFPWATAQILANREVVVEVVDDLPADAPIDRQSFARLRLRGRARTAARVRRSRRGIVLLRVDGRADPLGARPWSRDSGSSPRSSATRWPASEPRTRSVASETLKIGHSGSLTSGVAVLDRDGCIIAVNERWTGPGARQRPRLGRPVGRRRSAGACQREAETREASAPLLDGTPAVLAGRLPRLRPAALERGPRRHALSGC